MIRRILLSAVAAFAAGAVTAHADTKDDLQAAFQKLSDSANYSWSADTENANGPGFGAGTTEGQTEKDGFTHYTIPTRDGTTDVYTKGDKAAIKTDSGWQLASEILANADQNGGGGGGGGFDPNVFMARRVQTMKPPAEQAISEIGNLTNIQSTADGFSADFTQDGAKQLLTFGRRRPANADNNNNGGGNNFPTPDISNAKADLKVTVKDGVVTQTVLHVSGTVSFNGNDRDIDRTTTTTFKDVGSTTVTVPDDAKAKLNS